MKPKKFSKKLLAILRNNAEFAEFLELENLTGPPSLKFLLTRLGEGLLRAVSLVESKKVDADRDDDANKQSAAEEGEIAVPKWYKCKPMPNRLGGRTIRWEVTYRGHRFGLVYMDRFDPVCYSAFYRNEPKINYIKTLQDAVDRLVKLQRMYLESRVKK